jgi:hypothetical protein
MSAPTAHNFMRSIGVKTLQIYEKNNKREKLRREKSQNEALQFLSTKDNI